MNSIYYQALREVAQNYQSMLAWYQAIPDSPDARLIVMRFWLRLSVKSVTGKWILSPICWMNWKPQKSVLQNWRKRKKRCVRLVL